MSRVSIAKIDKSDSLAVFVVNQDILVPDIAVNNLPRLDLLERCGQSDSQLKPILRGRDSREHSRRRAILCDQVLIQPSASHELLNDKCQGDALDRRIGMT